MKIKVSAGFTGVISVGPFENMRPSYTAEVEFELENIVDTDPDLPNRIKWHQERLQEICQANFRNDEQKAIVDRIQRERADIRFYGDCPSVTSIINWDADFFISKEELQQYCSQGNLIDAQCKHFIKTGEWAPVKDIEGTWSDLVIISRGTLNLATEGWSFPNFLKKYPIEKMILGESVISKKHKYAGTSDIKSLIFEGKKYLGDIKRTAEKVKNGKQLAAYIMVEEENGETPYDGGMIIPLNDKTEQGFSKPIIYDRKQIEQYFSMFLKDRENFKKRFNA